MTRVLHTVRISNGDSVMYENKIREMIILELGKEIEKDVLRIVTSIGQRKTLSSHEESNLRPSYSTLRCSTNDEPHVERGLLRSSYSDTRPAYC